MTAAAPAPAERPGAGGWRRRPWWPWLRRALTLAFFALVATLVATQARRVQWGEVLQVLRDYPARRLAEAALLAALAHLVYATYDLLGRAWTGHRVSAPVVMAITFVSYAFNLNLGTWVGGFAFRYRLYARFGLDLEQTTRVLGLSLATNWLGYLLLGGAVFAAGAVEPPPGWRVGAPAVRVLGVAMVAAALGYLALCAWSRRREWTLRGHHVALPPARLALLQAVLSVLHWSVVGAVLYVLLQSRLPYGSVLATLLVAAVAGVIAHIPAGLGVLEAVFVALVGDRVPQGHLLAVLLAYRALYYLAPLLAASAVFLTLEARAKAGSAGEPGTPLAEPGHTHR